MIGEKDNVYFPQGDIFLCHSREDVELADIFNKEGLRIGVRIYRKEYEPMDRLPAERIRKDITASSALFVLVGPGLIKLLSSKEKTEWLHTTNWMSFEVGIATEVPSTDAEGTIKDLGRDIWIVTTDPKFNFPVMTFDALIWLRDYRPEGIEKLLDIVYSIYKVAPQYRLKNDPSRMEYWYVCPNTKCSKEFFSIWLEEGNVLRCPACGHLMMFLKGIFVPYPPIRIKPREMNGEAIPANKEEKASGHGSQ